MFPENMESRVARLQPGCVLKKQSVPPLLPAYNKFMGGVDRTDHLRKSYGFDRKCRRYWLCLFFQFFNYSINNAHILYNHSCKRHEIVPKDQLEFRMELHLLLERVKQSDKSVDTAQSERVCYLESVKKEVAAREI